MKYLAPIAAVLITLSIGIASITGLFQLPDALIYDQLVRLIPSRKGMVSPVLLVKSPKNILEKGDAVFLKALEHLEKMKPEKVVFTFIPQHASPAFFETAKTYGNVIFGRGVIADPHLKNTYNWKPLPLGLQESDITFGAVAFSPAQYGIYRHGKRHITINEKKIPTLEHLSAKLPGSVKLPGSAELPQSAELSMEKDQNTSDLPFLVNFNGKRARLPNISMERVLKENYVLEMIQDKVVIIGVEDREIPHVMYTPISPKIGNSTLEFQGLTTETLILKKEIHPTKNLTTLMLILVFVLFTLVTYQYMTINLFTLITLPTIFSYMVLSYLFLTYANTHLPVTEILLAHLITVYVVYRKRTLGQEIMTHKLMVDAASRVRQKYLPETFAESSEHWTKVINMVNQTLDLSRSIFLEKVPGDHRVKEVKALNCSLSVIDERRRDYQRTPYSTAIEEKGPILLKRNTYLKDAKESEKQYLVPLMLGGKILGFWAFGIESVKITQPKQFHAILEDFGVQIAELLYARKIKRNQEATDKKHFIQYLKLEGSQNSGKDLSKSILLMERRMAILDLILTRQGTATVFYDLFGTVMQTNNKMHDLLKGMNILIYELSALDFICRLAKLSIEEVRAILRDAIFDRRVTTLPVRLDAFSTNKYMLRVRPLFKEAENELMDDIHPFKIHGILLEIEEVTELTHINELRSDVLSYLTTKLRFHMAPILLGSSLLPKEEVDINMRRHIFEIVNRRIQELLILMEQTQEILKRDFPIGSDSLFPINPTKAMKKAISNVEQTAKKRRLAFSLQIPDIIGFVVSGPDELSRVFEVFLSTLIDDSEDGTKISVNIKERGSFVIFDFKNSGFGMPNEDFQGIISKESEELSGQYASLKKAIKKVNAWGGKVEALSQVGKGIEFSITFESGLSYLN